MARMLWIAVGAAGGIYAYRRGQRLLEQAREKGVVGSVQAATESATDAASSATRFAVQARSLLAARPEQGSAPGPASAGPTGAAAARALSESRRRVERTEGIP